MRSAIITAAMMPGLLVAGCYSRHDADPVPDPKVPITHPTASQYPSALPLVDSYKIVRDDRGKPAPTVKFTAPDGAKVTLAKFAGKPFILFLWGQLPSDAVAQLPDLDALAASGKIAVISLNTDDTTDFPDTVTRQLAALKLKTLADYRDPTSAMPNALGNLRVPVAVLFNSTGHQVLQIRGTVHYDDPEIRALLAEAK